MLKLCLAFISCALFALPFEVFLRSKKTDREIDLALITASSIKKDQNAHQFKVLATGGSSLYGEPYAPKIDPLKITGMYLKRSGMKNIVLNNLAEKGGTWANLLRPLLKHLAVGTDHLVLYLGINDYQDAELGITFCEDRWPKLPNALHGVKSLVFLTSKLQDLIFKYYQKHLLSFDHHNLYSKKFFCAQEEKQNIEYVREHLELLFSRFEQLGISTTIVAAYGNELNFSPNRSVYNGLEEDKNAFTRLFLCGKQQLEAGHDELSIKCLKKAYRIDPEFADLNYYLGIYYFRQKDYATAQIYLSTARNNDNYPIRISDKWNLLYKQMADKYKLVHMVDEKKVLKSISTSTLLDDSVYIDLSHPNLKGQMEMAKQMAQSILQVPIKALIHEEELKESFNWGISDDQRILLDRAHWFRAVAKKSYNQIDRIKKALSLIEEVDTLGGNEHNKKLKTELNNDLYNSQNMPFKNGNI